MDPPHPPSPPQSQSAVNSTSFKLRLMCSYGGQIIPRPRTKSLCYSGGETRIVSVNPTIITTLSAFISHLYTIFTIKLPITLKYQVPHLGLDSLISLSSDDDLQFMFCEHVRLSSSTSLPSAHSRIRLFIFFSKLETTQNVIHHPKTEAWFVDALKSAKILQKGRDFLVGYDGEGLIGDNEAKAAGDLANGGISLAESLVLETSSSFGSSSSSASSANLSPSKPQDEDVAFNSLDNAVKSTTSEPVPTLASEIVTTNSSAHPNSETCHGLVVRPPSVENAVVSIPVISDSNFHDARFHHAHNVIDISSYPLSSPSNPFQPQAMQFVPSPAPVENCLSGMFPVSSYYQVQQPQPQQQLLHYQPNQLYPVYFLPVGQTQLAAATVAAPYNNLPMQWRSSHPSVPLTAAPALPQVPYKEVTSEPRSQNLGASSVGNPTALKPCDEIQQPQIGEVACNHDEFNDEFERVQIYKSQPPAPSISSQFQNKTKASATLLSDAMAQLQMIQINQ